MAQERGRLRRVEPFGEGRDWAVAVFEALEAARCVWAVKGLSFEFQLSNITRPNPSTLLKLQASPVPTRPLLNHDPNQGWA